MLYNLRRWIARKLGFGGIEWERSHILDLPVKLILPADTDDNFIPVSMYPGGVQVFPNEAGTDGEFRYIWKYYL